MPAPDVNDVHVDRLLTNLSIGYAPNGYIADRLFPVVTVNTQTDLILEYRKSSFARYLGDDFVRAPGTNANTTGFALDKDKRFYCANDALGMEIPDEVVLNQDDPIDVLADSTDILLGLMRLRRDRRFAAEYMATGVWGLDVTVGAQWDDYGLSEPVQDLRRAIRRITRQSLATSGGRVLVVMGGEVWDVLSDHPDLLDRIKYSQTGIVGPTLLAAMLGESVRYQVDVIVGNSVYTTSPEGTPETSVVYQDVWGKDVLVLYRPETPTRMRPSAGYTFVWAPAVGGGNALEFVRRIREDRPRKTIIEVHAYYDQKQVGADMGVYLPDVIS